MQTRFRPCLSSSSSQHNNPQLGICVNDDLLGQPCVDQFMSKSTNCKAGQSCCVDATLNSNPDLFPASPAQNNQPALPVPDFSAILPQNNPQPQPLLPPVPKLINFTPARRPLVLFRNRNVLRRRTTPKPPQKCSATQLDPVKLGTCVPDLSVSSQCLGQGVFRSPDCSTDQICCIPVSNQIQNIPPQISQPPDQNSLDPSQTSFTPCVPDDKTAQSIGICVDNTLVANLCTQRIVSRSQNCFPLQSCCTEPQKPPQNVLGPSQNVFTLTKAPSVPVVTVNQDSFSPCSTPRAVMQFGICVPGVMVPDLCSGQFVGKSADCADDTETCCVGDATLTFSSGMEGNSVKARVDLGPDTTTTPPSTTTSTAPAGLQPGLLVWPQIFQQCIPIVDNFPLGVCVRESQVGSLCSGRLVAPSRSCALAESCCSYFPDTGGVTRRRPAAFPIPATTMTTTTTTVVMEPEVPVDLPPPLPPPPPIPIVAQNVFHPCAAAGTLVGVCVNEGSTTDYCLGKLIVASVDCGMAQLCCYDST